MPDVEDLNPKQRKAFLGRLQAINAKWKKEHPGKEMDQATVQAHFRQASVDLGLEKYSEDQERDDKGQFAGGGGGTVSGRESSVVEGKFRRFTGSISNLKRGQTVYIRSKTDGKVRRGAFRGLDREASGRFSIDLGDKVQGTGYGLLYSARSSQLVEPITKQAGPIDTNLIHYKDDDRKAITQYVKKKMTAWMASRGKNPEKSDVAMQAAFTREAIEALDLSPVTRSGHAPVKPVKKYSEGQERDEAGRFAGDSTDRAVERTSPDMRGVQAAQSASEVRRDSSDRSNELPKFKRGTVVRFNATGSRGIDTGKIVHTNQTRHGPEYSIRSLERNVVGNYVHDIVSEDEIVAVSTIQR